MWWLLFACSAPEAPDGDVGLVGYAAASLTDALPKVAEAWHAASGDHVTFTFGPTSRLASQVDAGAPGDVFFAADREWMQWLADRGRVAPLSPRDLLGNELVLVVPAASAWVPTGPADLAAPELQRLAVAGENVPAGKYGRAALRSAGTYDALEAKLVSGDDVRTALAWVAAGEAQAGIVYATDARAEPQVKVAFPFPASSHPPIVYPAGMLTASTHPQEAEAFLSWCGGAEARALFATAGFTTP